MEERAKWEKRAEGRDRGCERLREAGEVRGAERRAAAVKERAKRGKRAESRGRGCERLREAGESRGEERDCGRERAEIGRRG